ncbi:MAG: AAA family ATPase [Eubacterium sp.]|nr:AAA family ATPase [Eubacterium sp.]
MGIYVNPGNVLFQMSRFSEIYVDKSMLISKMNRVYRTEKRFVCVSRPRRFGKSMAANMLTAYYSCGCDSSPLFAELKVCEEAFFQKHLNRHQVIRIDVQRFLDTEKDLDTFIAEMESSIVSELVQEFPQCTGISPDGRLKTVLGKIFHQTAKGFIFIIDEWDCVFRIAKNRKEKQKEYMDFLRGLFKDSEYAELAYMTGILPIKKYGEHSALNFFDEYSMVDPKDLGEFFGFTQQEVELQCRKHHTDLKEMQKWYDGYRLGSRHMYNPKSVVDALTWNEFQSYWTGTETYEALKVYIDMNFDGLREAITVMLGNGSCSINTRRFQNDMTSFQTKDDVLTLLVHLGYLTYDKKIGAALIPNQEIAQEFLNAADGPGWSGLAQAISCSEKLLCSTWKMDGDAVAKGMAVIHNETASMLQYNNENSLTCAVLIAYYSAKAYYLNPVMELPSGRGFADVVYLPKRNVNRPALIIELKWNKTAQEAVRQIKEKEYAAWLEAYTGEILLVGINYDKKDKVHKCIIEKYVKS